MINITEDIIVKKIKGRQITLDNLRVMCWKKRNRISSVMPLERRTAKTELNWLGNRGIEASPTMVEIKLQGRGGQGVVVASEILARACFEEGMYPQCYSLFGGERRGAPVAAFIRISDSKIYLKCDIDHPNHLILFDKALFNEKEILEQVVPGGFVLLNMDERCQSNALKDYTVGAINAFEISKRNGLGAVVNTAILGAYIHLTQVISLDRLLKVIEETVPGAIDQNVAAAKEAYATLSFV